MFWGGNSGGGTARTKSASPRGKIAAGTKRSCINNLSLVVWGTNLTSLVGRGRLTKQESSMIILPPYQFSVIIGLLLSDG